MVIAPHALSKPTIIRSKHLLMGLCVPGSDWGVMGSKFGHRSTLFKLTIVRSKHLLMGLCVPGSDCGDMYMAILEEQVSHIGS